MSWVRHRTRPLLTPTLESRRSDSAISSPGWPDTPGSADADRPGTGCVRGGFSSSILVAEEATAVLCQCSDVSRFDGARAEQYANEHLQLIERARRSGGPDDHQCDATGTSWVLDFPSAVGYRTAKARLRKLPLGADDAPIGAPDCTPDVRASDYARDSAMHARSDLSLPWISLGTGARR